MKNDTRLTLSEVKGPFTDFVEKLEGEEGWLWLQEFKKFLRRENPWEKTDILVTIEIGTHKTVKSLRRAVLKSGASIFRWADDILNKVELSKSKQSLDLVSLSGKELGFSKATQLEDIAKAGTSLGLYPCPAEAAPQFIRQCSDILKKGEILIFVMEPIYDSYADLMLFYVERNGYECWLGAYGGRPGDLYHAGVRFVFVRRK